jgi:hypothetical protein
VKFLHLGFYLVLHRPFEPAGLIEKVASGTWGTLGRKTLSVKDQLIAGGAVDSF